MSRGVLYQLGKQKEQINKANCVSLFAARRACFLQGPEQAPHRAQSQGTRLLLSLFFSKIYFGEEPYAPMVPMEGLVTL